MSSADVQQVIIGGPAAAAGEALSVGYAVPRAKELTGRLRHHHDDMHQAMGQ